MTADLEDHSQRPRLAWIDAVRGTAVLMVVAYHSVVGLDVARVVAPRWIEVLNDAISPLRMPLLMLISGLLLPRSLRKPAKDYVSGKLRNIGWPYLVWTAVTLTFWFVGSRTIGAGNASVRSMLAVLVDPRTYTWYLAYLLLYYLIALIVPDRVRPWLIPILLVLSGVLDDGEGWSRLTNLLGFFLLGEWLTLHPSTLQAARRAVPVIGGSLALAATLAAAAYRLPIRYQPWSVFGVLGAVIVAIPLWAGTNKWATTRALERIGRDSIVYYVTHWPVVAAGAHVVARLHVRQGGLAVTVLMALSLGASALAVVLRHRWAWVAALYACPSSSTEVPRQRLKRP